MKAYDLCTIVLEKVEISIVIYRSLESICIDNPEKITVVSCM